MNLRENFLANNRFIRLPTMFTYTFILFMVISMVQSIAVHSVQSMRSDGGKRLKTIAYGYILPPVVLDRPNSVGISHTDQWPISRSNLKIQLKAPLLSSLNDPFGSISGNGHDLDADQEPLASIGIPMATNLIPLGFSGYNHPSGHRVLREKSFLQYHRVPLIRNNFNLNIPSAINPILPLHPMFASAGAHRPMVINNYHMIQLGKNRGRKVKLRSFIDVGHLLTGGQNRDRMFLNPNGYPSTGMLRPMMSNQWEHQSNNFLPVMSGYGSGPIPEDNGALTISLPSQFGPQIELSPSGESDDIRRSNTAKRLRLVALGRMNFARDPYTYQPLKEKMLKGHMVKLGPKSRNNDTSFLSTYENTPDSAPLSLKGADLGKYYTSTSFTDGVEGIPYEPSKLGFFKNIKWLPWWSLKHKELRSYVNNSA